MTPLTAARIVNVHPSTIKRHCSEGRLAPQCTSGGHRRITPGDLADYLHHHHRGHILHSTGAILERYLEALLHLIDREEDGKLLDVLFEAVLCGQEASFQSMVDHLFNIYPKEVLVYGTVLLRLLSLVKTQYTAGSIGVADEHRFSQAIKDACARHYLHDIRHMKPCGRQALIGCAQGDHHDISALVTRIIFIRRGYSVRFLGSDVPDHAFREEQERWNADIVCISRTLPAPPIKDQTLLRSLLSKQTQPPSFEVVLGGTWSDWTRSWASRNQNVTLLKSMTALDAWLETRQGPSRTDV